MFYSNEYIKLESTRNGEIFECRPNDNFKMPFGEWKSWNEARIIDSETGETAVIFKAGQIVDNPKRRVKKVKEPEREKADD